MDTVQKKMLFLLMMISLMSCKAQEYPLKTDYTEIPNNSYLKDINYELDIFVGNYTTNFQEGTIMLFITKQNHLFC